jgi:hypothetical protein
MPAFLTRFGLDHLEQLQRHPSKGPGELVLSGSCHPGRPVMARYTTKTGLLELRCAKCAVVVATILVAERSEVQ